MSKYLFIRDMLYDDTELIVEEWIKLLDVVQQGIDRTDVLTEAPNDESQSTSR